MDLVISLITVIYCVLNIILLFKIWGMTNDVRRIAERLSNQSNVEVSQPVEKKKYATIKSTGEEVEIIGESKGYFRCVRKGTDKIIGTYSEEKLDFIS